MNHSCTAYLYAAFFKTLNKNIMKYFSLLFLLAAYACTVNAQHTVAKLWSSDTVLPETESVYFDAANKVLYVSVIDGDPSAKDSKGEIAKVGLDGKIINASWVSGLNAPKGIGKYGDLLFVADVTDLAIIDIKTGKVTNRLPIPGSSFLNDVTVDANGVVYVSDSDKGLVYKIESGIVVTYLDNLKGPNGVLAIKDNLYVLISGNLVKVDADKKMQTIATGLDPSTDGIEMVQDGEFIVSSWSGIVYYVKADGSKDILYDTRESKINAADIGFDPKKKIIYVPTFFKNGVVAYSLK